MEAAPKNTHTMTHEQKIQVKEALMRYVANFDTQAQAAATLQGVTAAAISSVKNDKWQLVSNNTWLNIARQVGFYCRQWHHADTSVSLLLGILLGDAQRYTMAYGVAIEKGLGKTFAAQHYAREHENVIYMRCLEAHNRRSFMAGLMEAARLRPSQSLPDMVNAFTAAVSYVPEMVIVLDDTHLLKDRVLQLVITLANSLTGVAGMVLMGNAEWRNRITGGVKENKAGYERIYNSFGRRFVTINSLSPRDAETICRANNITDEHVIAQIVAEATDLHAVTEMIKKYYPVAMAA